MKNEIIELCKQSIDKINEIDDIIDALDEDITDLTDTASDLIAPIKAIKATWLAAKKMRFRRFLKSYSQVLKDNFGTSEAVELSEKLKQYLKHERNLNFIYDTIDSALNAKSVICSGILGYLSSEILSKQLEVGYEDLVFLNALRSLNDIELQMTLLIFENTADGSLNNTISKIDNLKPYQTLCEYTVQKLKGLQVFEEIHGGPGRPVSLGQSFWGTYTYSPISENFFLLIRESGYYDEIKQNKASA